MYVLGKVLVFVLAGCNAAIAVIPYLERVCQLPLDVGKPCGDKSIETKMFYFKSDIERCTSFNYTGCEGNDNKFAKSDDCIDSCQTPWLLQKDKEGGDTDNNMTSHRQISDCQLQPDGGPCRAMIIMWYFDNLKANCSSFVYGGCKGNPNRFDNEAQCQEYCHPNVTNTTAPPKV